MLMIILVSFVFCFILERANPGWTLPKVKNWNLRVLAINAVQLGVVYLGGLTWERWFQQYSVFQLSQVVAPLVGGAIAYFIATFVFYWWHRWRHESDLLWRLFHQIHHSPGRLEVITSFYKHPQEMVVNSLIGGILVYVLLGLNPIAGAYYTMFTALGEFFYHTNVKTPRWVGWFFQRPEMHRIHHQYGRHKNNYGDITWWDMLFGTYENPKEWTDKCGFEPERELRLMEMLKCKDVHKDAVKTSQSSVALILSVALAALPFSQQAEACSVFAQKTAKGFIVAKNFDWNAPGGVLVKNGRNTHRQSFNPKASHQWQAKYASVSFNSIGPGLPVSGMNEKGIVIEALVDHDYDGEIAMTDKLTALEWSQYVLDNFATLPEIIDFAANSDFDQQVVGLHFFICDREQQCGVFERRVQPQPHIKVTAGKHLAVPVLANNGWAEDYAASQRHKKIKKVTGSSLLLPNSSKKRFLTLTRVEAGNATAAFAALDQARIPHLVQWQIVWDPVNLTVSWRHFENQKPQPVQRLDLGELFATCSQDIGVRDVRATARDFAPYKDQQLILAGERLGEMMSWRVGRNFPKFEQDIVKFTSSAQCRI